MAPGPMGKGGGVVSGRPRSLPKLSIAQEGTIWHALEAAKKATLACGAIAKASEWEPFRKAYLLREAKGE